MSHASSFFLLTALLAAGSTAARGQTSFVFEPAAPTSNETVTIRATYDSACQTGPASTEVLGQAIRITAYEGCICPPVIPGPVVISTTVGPLPAGTYAVALEVAPDPLDPECALETRAIGDAELEVKPAPPLLVFEPPSPTADDEVTVTVRDLCPFGVEAPSRQGRLLRITTLPSAILAPCSTTPTWEAMLPLGRLPAGDYTAVVAFDGGDGAPLLTYSRPFTVLPAAGSELLLADGRYRVEARWRLENGTEGVASSLALTRDSGALWFFRPDNLELLAKVLNGCPSNGHVWFFVAGLTNVGVDLALIDTFTGAERNYGHDPGKPFLPLLDTMAFPCGR